MVRQGRAVHKKLAAIRGEIHRLEGPRGQPPYLVEADYSLPMADVILGPGAAAILDSFGGGIVVSLERDPAGGDPVPVVVYSGEDLVSGRSARRVGVEPGCPGCRAAGRPVLDGSRHPE